jgi:hypothetical protein
MRKQASESIPAKDIRRRYSPRPGPEGREMARAASVSASKTPTAKAVSEGRCPERGGSSVRGSACERSEREETQGLAVGVGPGDSQGTTPTRTAWRVGGLGRKKALLSAFLGHGPPEQAVSPGSSRGLDARGLRELVHLDEQVGEQVSEQVEMRTDCDRVRIVLNRSCSRGFLSIRASRSSRRPPGRTRPRPPETR